MNIILSSLFDAKSALGRFRMGDKPFQPIAVTSHERHGVSFHRPLYCLSNGLCSATSNDATKLRITAICEANPTVASGSPHKGLAVREKFPPNEYVSELDHQIVDINVKKN